MASTIEKLVKDAAKVVAELRDLEGGDGQLTREAYLSACRAMPGASVEEAKTLERKLEY